MPQLYRYSSSRAEGDTTAPTEQPVRLPLIRSLIPRGAGPRHVARAAPSIPQKPPEKIAICGTSSSGFRRWMERRIRTTQAGDYKVTNTVLSKIKVPKLNLLLKHFYMMVGLGIAKGEENASSLDKGERRTTGSTVLAGQTFARGTGLLVLYYFRTYPHASD